MRVHFCFVSLRLCVIALAIPANLHGDDFGNRQIAQMLDDRPSMQGIVPSDHAIHRFVSDHFAAGGLNHKRVHWDYTEPVHAAEHVCQTLCVVRVTKGAEYTGRDKWAMVVFEMFNLTHANAVGNLRWRAVKNAIERDDFIEQCLKLELDAMRKAQAFLKKNPIPDAEPKVDKFYFSFIHTQTDFDAYVQFLDSWKGLLSYDPREYNGETFDSLRPQHGAVENGGEP